MTASSYFSSALNTSPDGWSAGGVWGPSGMWTPIEQHFPAADPVPDAEGLIEYILIPLRDTVIFPRTITPLLIGRDSSLQALTIAHQARRLVLFATQIDPGNEDPTADDLYRTGTEAAIGQLLRLPDGANSAIVRGQRRVQVVEFIQTEPYFVVRGRPYPPESTTITNETEAMMRAVLTLFERLVQLNTTLPEEAYIYALNITLPGELADLIANTLDLSIVQRQAVLETIDPVHRLQAISGIIGRELDVLELEDRIHAQVQQEMDRTQREMYLREQLRTIQLELGEGDIWSQEISDLREKIVVSTMPDDIQEAAYREVERLQQIPPMAPETGIIRTYLEWLLAIPWTEATDDNLDLDHAEKVLEQSHYGLPRVKERILEYLAVRKLAPSKMRQPILCFMGPPGTGKTSLGKSIAEALGRKFVRISLGGVRDEAEIRGHRRTYIGALPGRILQTMRRVGTVNPVFMLDEIDKLSSDYRGDPASALLEVLDPEQNHTFTDHYLALPYDLSRVLFITTANHYGTMPWALEDRMEFIEFSGYTDFEKINIARQFLIPKQLDENGLEPDSLRFPNDTLQAMIRRYTYESGVRELDRQIAKVCRKITRRKASQKRLPRRIDAAKLTAYLGPAQHTELGAEKEDTIGVATSLAWTMDGGEIMPIEVQLIEDSKGSLTLTGRLGEVMRESYQAGFSWLRAHAQQLGIDPDRLDNTDIHVHMPEGAIPKDGPSAGITLLTAVISAFTGAKVRKDVGMTGEITLRGLVLPIGGVREKLLAAHRNGLKTVLLPRRNEKDLDDLPKQITRELKIEFVDTINDVLRLALLPPPKTLDPQLTRRRFRRIKPHNRRPTRPERPDPPNRPPRPGRPSAASPPPA